MVKITKEMIKELKERTDAGLLDSRRALQEAEGDIQKALEILKAKGLALFEKRQGRSAGHVRIFVSIDNLQHKAGVLLVNSETDFAANNQDFITLFQSILDEAIRLDKQSIGDEYAEKIALLGSQLTEKLTIQAYHFYPAQEGSFFVSYLHKGHSLGLVEFHSQQSDDFNHSEISSALKKIAVHVVGATPKYLSVSDVSREDYEAIYQQFAQNVDQSKPEDIQKKMIEGQISKRIKEDALLSQPFAFNEKQSVEDYVLELNKQHATNLSIKHFVLFENN